jgi:hypothetical protein
MKRQRFPEIPSPWGDLDPAVCFANLSERCFFYHEVHEGPEEAHSFITFMSFMVKFALGFNTNLTGFQAKKNQPQGLVLLLRFKFNRD